MKLFNAIAAAAVAGALSTMFSLPANSEVHADLDRGTLTGVNNGMCMYYVTKNGATKSMSTPSGSQQCNPWTVYGVGYSQTMQIWGSSRQEAEGIWQRL